MEFKNIKDFTSGGKSLTKIYHSGGVVWEKDYSVKINSSNLSTADYNVIEISDLDLKKYGGIRKIQILFDKSMAQEYRLDKAFYIWFTDLNYEKVNATASTKGNVITFSLDDKAYRIEQIWISFETDISRIGIDKFDVRYKIIS